MQLVPVSPSFSNDNQFRKDIQMTLDENLINHFLMGLFYTKEQYSLTEYLLSMMPGNMKQISKMASNFFTSTIFSPAFPQLAREIGHNKRIDIRCGFSKQFMTGKLDDTYISQIWFKKDNIIEFNFNFGCGVVYNAKSTASPLSIFKSLDIDSSEWLPWRTFFYSLRGDIKFDFKSIEQINGLLTGKIDTFNL